MPGYGFSGKPTTTGWDPARIARAWVVLMQRLGYERFVAQGGDWGAIVTNVMAEQAPPELIGIHTNMPGILPPDIAKALQPESRRPPASQPTKNAHTSSWPSSTSTWATGSRWARARKRYTDWRDSPIALAALMLDHDAASYDHDPRVFQTGSPRAP